MGNPFSKEEKVFSICTPVYGEAWRTFEKFFQCLDQQDYKAFEVIVCFDGPNKAGQKELKRMIKLYPNMKIRSTEIEHAGAPSARNAAADLAVGDFISSLDPDVYLYSETLRIWANAFDEKPDKDVIWGLYDVDVNGQAQQIGGQVPVKPDGQPDYWAFRFSNYCSGAFPIRRDAFLGWTPGIRSLQDWDQWVRMLKLDNFEGKKFHYIKRSFFLTDMPYKGGISDDSAKNWLERVRTIKKLNGIPLSDICVTSLGAPLHGLHVAKKLGADYLPMPSYKPHEYKSIYLLGFYCRKHEERMAHFEVFNNDGQKSKKVVHWIGSDVMQLDRNVSSFTLRELKKIWKEKEFIMLTEAQHTHDEMLMDGVETKIVPIPPQKLYDAMPLPSEFTVAIYDNGTGAGVYNMDLMDQIARSMPDVKFYFFGNESRKGDKYNNVEHLGWIDLDEWMPKFSCNLRVTQHDGLPLTPVQFMTAGRDVVTNVKLKHALITDGSRKDIVKLLRSAQANPCPSFVGDYWRKEMDFDKYVATMKGIL